MCFAKSKCCLRFVFDSVYADMSQDKLTTQNLNILFGIVANRAMVSEDENSIRPIVILELNKIRKQLNN